MRYLIWQIENGNIISMIFFTVVETEYHLLIGDSEILTKHEIYTAIILQIIAVSSRPLSPLQAPKVKTLMPNYTLEDTCKTSASPRTHSGALQVH